MKKSMTISYEIGNKLYLNLTNKCPCSCTFCIRNNDDGAYGSDPLWLEHEPSMDEIKADLSKRDIASYSEIVFCGYGEPTSRLDVMLETAEYLKSAENCPKLRLNTNGLSDCIAGRSTAEEICSVMDIISVSLNNGSEEEYIKVTRPRFENAYSAMQKFTADCVKTGKSQVMMTIVDVIPEDEIKACQAIADSIGATLRIRPYES